MKYFDFSLKHMNMSQWILFVLLIVFYILGEPVPQSMGPMLSTKAAKIIIVVAALSLFAYTNVYLAILGLFVAYSLITHPTSNMTNMSNIPNSNGSIIPQWSNAYPTEKKYPSPFSPHHQFPYTLEQEMVKKMAPMQKVNQDNTQNKFKPLIDNLYNAAPVNYQGVI